MTTEDQDLTIPGYRLMYSLGRGNTSQVRLAIDPEGRQVAVKIPHPGALKVHEAAERFANEVRLTLKLRHENLIRGYAGTPFGDQAFLALEYYPNGALSDQLSRMGARALPQPQVLRILADIATALTFLHKQGAVHQDVKPQNVYVDQGRAALGDLGNTYFEAQGGKVSGSPFYMAPEIYHGEHSSSASDVYSLGIMMYELLGGQRPYQGNTYEELMIAHLTRFPPPLSHLNAEVPRQVARLAELALAKRPGDRPSANTIRKALLEALGAQPQEVLTQVEEEPEPTPTPQNVGRHGVTAPTAPPIAPPTAPRGGASAKGKPPEQAGTAKPEDKGFGWNPFKRKK